MIRVQNLTKEYGDVRAIDDLSFEVLEGEILGFLGPNGAGKTSTMRILTCFFPPTSGQARVGGFDVVEDPHEVRRLIGYLPEGVPLYREMTVAAALDFVAHAKGFKSAQRAKVVDLAMEETGLGGVRNRIIGHLSKGYRQRVGLAQAVLGEPKVLILDEPTVGLDPRQITEIRSLIRSMAGRRTVILSTHILPEVQMTCSKVIIINRGRIAAQGTPERLTTEMQGERQTALRVNGPVDQVLAGLLSIEDVISANITGAPGESSDLAATVDPADHEYIVSTHAAGPDLGPALAALVVRRGWLLKEIRPIGLSLEDLFLKVIAGESAPTSTPSPTSEPESVQNAV